MCVPSNVRLRWLKAYSSTAYCLLGAIEALSGGDGCTDPISLATLSSAAGIKSRDTRKKALAEIQDEIAVTTVSERRSSYSLLCLIDPTVEKIDDSHAGKVNDSVEKMDGNDSLRREIERNEGAAPSSTTVEKIDASGGEEAVTVENSNGNRDSVEKIDGKPFGGMEGYIDHKDIKTCPPTKDQPRAGDHDGLGDIVVTADHEYSDDETIRGWQLRRTAALRTASKLETVPEKGELWHRRAAIYLILVGQGVRKDAAVQHSQNDPIVKLEQAVDYFLFRRASGEKLRKANGQSDVVGAGWLVSHLENDHGTSDEYHPLWRWPEERRDAEQEQSSDRFAGGKYADLIDNNPDPELEDTVIDDGVISQDCLETEIDAPALLPERTDGSDAAAPISAPVSVYDVYGANRMVGR